MNFNVTDCSNNNKNVGKPRCSDTPSYTVAIMVCPRDKVVATKTLAMTEATWLTMLNDSVNSRCYILPSHFKVEETKEDDKYEEGVGGKKEFAREGNKSGKYFLEDIPIALHKALRTLNNQSWAFYKIQSDGSIRGKSIDDVKFLPFPAKLFRVEGRKESTGDEKERTSIMLEWENPNDWDDYGVSVKPTAFDPRELKSIVDVSITVVSALTTGIIVNIMGAIDGEPKSGFVTADCEVLNSGGTSETIVVAESQTIDGQYTITKTPNFSAGTYTVDLKGQPAMTTKGYEAEEAVEAVIHS